MAKKENDKSIIGENSFFEGKFSIDGELQVDGKFEGRSVFIDILHITKKGKIKSNVNVNNAIIEGIIIEGVVINLIGDDNISKAIIEVVIMDKIIMRRIPAIRSCFIGPHQNTIPGRIRDSIAINFIGRSAIS